MLQTLRRIICLSNNDAEKLTLYSDAQALLADIPASSFPAREVAWLVTTCFNRGCQHAKFCRYDTAQSFMRAAIDLLPHCPELGGKREVKLILWAFGLSSCSVLGQRWALGSI